MKFLLLQILTFTLLIVAIAAKGSEENQSLLGKAVGAIGSAITNCFGACLGADKSEEKPSSGNDEEMDVKKHQIMHTGSSLSEQFCRNHMHFFEHLLFHPRHSSAEQKAAGVLKTNKVHCEPNQPMSPPVANDSDTVHLKIEKPAAELVLHIWLRAATNQSFGAIFAEGCDTNKIKPLASSDECCDETWFDFVEVEFDGTHKCTVHLSWSKKTTLVSYMYSYQPEHVNRSGIHVLYSNEANKHPPIMREAFHMRSPVGWMNDPNGFSHTKKGGPYHLFYQFFPHQRKWGTMHWGHTISWDMVTWVQLPVFMRPTKVEVGGGRFSGSALPLENGGLHIFFTGRTIIRPEPSFWADEFQFSVEMDAKKILVPTGPPKLFLDQRPMPNEFTYDFRDPAVVIAPDGFYYMVLGTRYADLSSGVTLLYKSKMKGNYSSGWEFKGIFHTDGRDQMKVNECNGLIPIGNPKNSDTLWAFIYGRDSSVDTDGRVNISPMLLTEFNESLQTFQKLADNMDGKENGSNGYKPQEIDFAGGSYAYQGFYDEIKGESLLIGWLWDCGDPNNCIASMTLPRKLELSADRKAILQKPHPNLAKLRGNPFCAEQIEMMQNDGLALDKDSRKLEVEFKINVQKKNNTGAEVQLVVDLANGEKFSVVSNSEGFKVAKTWQKTRNLIVRGVNPKDVRVFIDVDSVEVFADNGRWVGCARLTDAAVKVTLLDPKKVTSDVKAWQIDLKANVYTPEQLK